MSGELISLNGGWPRCVVWAEHDGKAWIGVGGCDRRDAYIESRSLWGRLSGISSTPYGMDGVPPVGERLPECRWWELGASVTQRRVTGVLRDLAEEGGGRVCFRYSGNEMTEGMEYAPPRVETRAPQMVAVIRVGDSRRVERRYWTYPVAAAGSLEFCDGLQASRHGKTLYAPVPESGEPSLYRRQAQAMTAIDRGLFGGHMAEAASAPADQTVTLSPSARITSKGGWLLSLTVVFTVAAQDRAMAVALAELVTREWRPPHPDGLAVAWDEAAVSPRLAVDMPAHEWVKWRAWLGEHDVQWAAADGCDPDAPWNHPVQDDRLERIPGWATPAPSGRCYRDFQREGIRFLATRGMRALLADDMGLGKTAQAIAAAQYRQAERVLIVSPASIRGVWADEIEMWSGETVDSGRVQQLRDAHDSPEAEDTRWLIATYDQIVTANRPFHCRSKNEMQSMAAALNASMDKIGREHAVTCSVRSVKSKKDKTTTERYQLSIHNQAEISNESDAAARAVMTADRHGAWDRFVAQRRGHILHRLEYWQPDLVIFDEAHRLKNASAKRTGSAIRLSAASGGCLLLSGTPIQNRTMEPAVMLHVMDPAAYDEVRRGDRITVERVKGLLGPTMLRRRKSEVLAELPPVVEQSIGIASTELARVGRRPEETVSLHDDPDQRMYMLDALEHAGASVLADRPAATPSGRGRNYDVLRAAWSLGNESADPGPGKPRHNPADLPPMSIFEVIRTRLGAEKAADPQVSDLILDVIENRGCAVVFTAHHDTSDRLREVLTHQNKSLRVAVFDGRLPPARRQPLVSRFQSGDLDCLIVGMEAGGEGITLHRADTCVFVEMAQKPSTIQQSRDRLHRIGQRSTVQAYYLVANNPIDEFFRDLCLDKAMLTSRVLTEEVQVLAETVRELAEATG